MEVISYYEMESRVNSLLEHFNINEFSSLEEFAKGNNVIIGDNLDDTFYKLAGSIFFPNNQSWPHTNRQNPVRVYTIWFCKHSVPFITVHALGRILLSRNTTENENILQEELSYKKDIEYLNEKCQLTPQEIRVINANRFAECYLLPKEKIEKSWSHRHQLCKNLENIVTVLADIYQVPEHIMDFRLKYLKFIPTNDTEKDETLNKLGTCELLICPFIKTGPNFYFNTTIKQTKTKNNQFDISVEFTATRDQLDSNKYWVKNKFSDENFMNIKKICLTPIKYTTSEYLTIKEIIRDCCTKISKEFFVTFYGENEEIIHHFPNIKFMEIKNIKVFNQDSPKSMIDQLEL